MNRLAGKRAIITGGARGIGAGIARAFITEGADVILVDRDAEAAEATASALGCHFFPMDVAQEAGWTVLAALHPAIDVMVNNAGITGFEESMGPHDPEHVSLDEWRRVLAVNLDGVFLGCRYAIAAMRHAGGRGSIINIASRSGLVGVPGAAAYAASKAAIRNHGKTVALWCAQEGLAVRCNTILPAAILTPMWEPMLGDGPDRDARMAALTAETPLKRFGTVDEVAAVALLLASDECPYMTGTDINLDGGLLAGSAAAPGRSDQSDA